MARTPPRCLIACRDLLAYSRLAGAAREADWQPAQATDAEALKRELRRASALVVDLQDPAGGVQAVRTARASRRPIPIVAVGPHKDELLQSQAREAGATHVLTNAVAATRLPRILAEIEPHVPPPGPTDGPPAPTRPETEPPPGPEETSESPGPATERTGGRSNGSTGKHA